MTINYKGQAGQSIYDVCLMTYGTFDKIITLVKDSILDSVSDEFIAGKIFPFESSLISDVSLANLIKNTKRVFATATPPDGLATDDGILLTTDDGIVITVD